jgi:hypothetical protein
MRNLRLNDYFMQNDLDWNKLTTFAKKFEKQVILEKIDLLKKLFLEDI